VIFKLLVVFQSEQLSTAWICFKYANVYIRN